MMKKSSCCAFFVFLRLEMLFSGKHVERALPMLFTWGNFGSHIFQSHRQENALIVFCCMSCEMWMPQFITHISDKAHHTYYKHSTFLKMCLKFFCKRRDFLLQNYTAEFCKWWLYTVNSGKGTLLHFCWMSSSILGSNIWQLFTSWHIIISPVT